MFIWLSFHYRFRTSLSLLIFSSIETDHIFSKMTQDLRLSFLSNWWIYLLKLFESRIIFNFNEFIYAFLLWLSGMMILQVQFKLGLHNTCCSCHFVIIITANLWLLYFSFRNVSLFERSINLLIMVEKFDLTQDHLLHQCWSLI